MSLRKIPLREPLRFVEDQFDRRWYAATYLTPTEFETYGADPFVHYLRIGMRAGYSPNSWFQEDWYRAFYGDVREAIVADDFFCGFHHYVTMGKNEGRLPAFDQVKAAEAKLLHVTEPTRLASLEYLQRRLFATDAERAIRVVRNAPPTVWFLLPLLSPEITFGGYRAAFELLGGLRRAGHRVALYCSEDSNPNLPYFLWRERSERTHRALHGVPVFSAQDMGSMEIGEHDRFLVYTVWDLYCAERLAARTRGGRPYLLAQEYEPVFFDNSSTRVLSEEAYRIPHYPIFNGALLVEYFKRHRLGIFSKPSIRLEFEDFAVFEHRINQLGPQTASQMSARTKRVLGVYARPESHASRNLFELIVLALRAACAKGAFDASWSFVGVGALAAGPPVPLGGGHELVMYQRMPECDYRKFFGALDVGISMMFAPHPSVVPYEFATTGALVVTNVYDNRSADQLRAVSENIVPCEVALSDLTRAIVEAAGRVGEYDRRARNAFVPKVRTWDDVFSNAFVERTFGKPSA